MATEGSANSACWRPTATPRGTCGASEAPGTGSGSAAAPSASSQKRLRSCSRSSPSGPASVVTPSRSPRSGDARLPPAKRHSRKRPREGPPGTRAMYSTRTPSPEVNGVVLAISKTASPGLSAGMTLRHTRAWPASMPPTQPASAQASAATHADRRSADARGYCRMPRVCRGDRSAQYALAIAPYSTELSACRHNRRRLDTPMRKRSA